jgi:hypothetical protein
MGALVLWMSHLRRLGEICRLLVCDDGDVWLRIALREEEKVGYTSEEAIISPS